MASGSRGVCQRCLCGNLGARFAVVGLRGRRRKPLKNIFIQGMFRKKGRGQRFFCQQFIPVNLGARLLPLLG